MFAYGKYVYINRRMKLRIWRILFCISLFSYFYGFTDSFRQCFCSGWRASNVIDNIEASRKKCAQNYQKVDYVTTISYLPDLSPRVEHVVDLVVSDDCVNWFELIIRWWKKSTVTVCNKIMRKRLWRLDSILYQMHCKWYYKTR